MKPEAQRIAIAEACPEVAYVHHGIPRWNKYGSSNQTQFNPLSDLNAMHEAEKICLTTQGLRATYVSELFAVTKATATQYIIMSTAAQRAEAFLRTLNLWKD